MLISLQNLYKNLYNIFNMKLYKFGCFKLLSEYFWYICWQSSIYVTLFCGNLLWAFAIIYDIF